MQKLVLAHPIIRGEKKCKKKGGARKGGEEEAPATFDRPRGPSAKGPERERGGTKERAKLGKRYALFRKRDTVSSTRSVNKMGEIGSGGKETAHYNSKKPMTDFVHALA